MRNNRCEGTSRELFVLIDPERPVLLEKKMHPGSDVASAENLRKKYYRGKS